MIRVLNIQKKSRHMLALLTALTLLFGMTLSPAVNAADVGDVSVIEGNDLMVLIDAAKETNVPDIKSGTKLIFTPGPGVDDFTLTIEKKAVLKRTTDPGFMAPPSTTYPNEFGDVLLGPGASFDDWEGVSYSSDISKGDGGFEYKGLTYGDPASGPFENIEIVREGFISLTAVNFALDRPSLNHNDLPNSFLQSADGNATIAGYLTGLVIDLDDDKSGTVEGFESNVLLGSDLVFDSAVFTWNKVALASGDGDVTFQIELFADDTITITYAEIPKLAPAQMESDNPDHSFGLVGISDGDAVGGGDNVEFSLAPVDLPVGSIEANAIFENYIKKRGEIVGLDVVEVAKAFYAAPHDDIYDMLVIFTDFPLNQGFAISSQITNKTLGIGKSTRDIGDLAGGVGSDGELEQIINLNHIALSRTPDVEEISFGLIDEDAFPEGQFPDGVGTPGGFFDDTGSGSGFLHRFFLSANANSATTTTSLTPSFGALGRIRQPQSVAGGQTHEIMHRWCCYKEFIDPEGGFTEEEELEEPGVDGSTFINQNSTYLLGRQEGHWSHFMDTRIPDGQLDGDNRSSVNEGNYIVDVTDEGNPADKALIDACDALGLDAFRNNREELSDGNSALDQYLMGVRTESDVLTFSYIHEPFSPIQDPVFGGAMNNETTLILSDFQDPESILFEGRNRRNGIAPLDDLGYCGTRVDVEVSDLIDYGLESADHGALPKLFREAQFLSEQNRSPMIGDEQDNVGGGSPHTLGLGVFTAAGGSEETDPDTRDLCNGLDSDHDGINDVSEHIIGANNRGEDNCPLTFNPDQTDSDGNGYGDACEEEYVTGPFDDDDGDFVFNTFDNCPQTGNGPLQDNQKDSFGVTPAQPGDACRPTMTGVSGVSGVGQIFGPDPDGEDGPRTDLVLLYDPAAIAALNARESAVCTDVKTIAYILVTREGQSASQGSINSVDLVRQSVDTYTNRGAIGGRGARGCIAGYSHTGVDKEAKCYDPEGDERSLCAGNMMSTTCIEETTLETRDYIPKFDTSLTPTIH